MSSDDTLFVIVPYFNFLNYKSGLVNLNWFIRNLSLYNNVEIVLVEGYNSKDEMLPDLSDNLYKHIKLHVPHTLWVKENLINIGVRALPSDWKYISWIDRDIMFCNPNWVTESISKLQDFDLIQPWKECLFLNNKHEHESIDFGEWSLADSFLAHSFCSVQYNKKNKIEFNSKIFSHPGQAWCMTRKLYNKIGKIYEYNIVGGGDGDMMWCLMGDMLNLKVINNHMYKYLLNLKDVNVSYIDGLIMHYDHGKLSKRLYLARNDIMSKHKYNPDVHLCYTNEGVIKFTEKGNIMAKDIRDYFVYRQEDEDV